jgi:cytochrome c5
VWTAKEIVMKTQGLPSPFRLLVWLFLCWAASSAVHAQANRALQGQASQAGQSRQSGQPAPGDYAVQNGRVDAGTYAGWRLFHTACYGCHGVDATGTDLAPNLVERIKSMSPRDFVTKVLTSYRLMPAASGAEGNSSDDNAALEGLIEQALRKDRSAAKLIAMPAWDDNPRVRPHVLDLYAYLTARADGKLAPGKPQQIARK